LYGCTKAVSRHDNVNVFPKQFRPFYPNYRLAFALSKVVLEALMNAPTDGSRARSFNLENLRKQAKRLLRQVRARDADAPARIRSSHHTYRNSSDSELASFSLQDAQLVIARELGFSSWPKLIAAERSEKSDADLREPDYTPQKGPKMQSQFSLPAQLIVLVLSKENPAAIAVALAHMGAGLAAATFQSLSEDTQHLTIIRMATFGSDGSESIRELNEISTPELKPILMNEVVRGLDGIQSVAQLLRQLSRHQEDALLEVLKEHDKEVAEAIQRRIFVFGDLEGMTDREIQAVLRETNMKDLAIALKGASNVLKGRIMSNVSETVAKEIEDEMKYSGPVQKSDVDEIQARISQIIRDFEESGQIGSLRGDPDPFL